MQQEADLITILKTSLLLIKNQPKLFLPKTIIAIFYGILIIFESRLIVDFITVLYSAHTAPQLLHLLIFGGILLIFNIIVYVLDTIITAIYPALIKQCPNTVSFKKAFLDSKKRINLALFWATILLIFIFVISTITILILNIFNQTNLLIQLIIPLTIGLIFSFIFYLIFPIIMLEDKSLKNSVKETIKISFNNKKKIFILSLIPLIVTLIKFGLATNITNIFALVIFVILTLLTAIIHTYSAVTTQTAYFLIKQKN